MKRHGVNIVIRKMVLALAAVAIVTAGSASTAAAMHGGGGFHGGGFGHGGFGHAGFGRFGRPFGPRFGAFAVGFPYGYYGCYTRVWGPWGWRWQYLCY
jgi:hypothetical protein